MADTRRNKVPGGPGGLPPRPDQAAPAGGDDLKYRIDQEIAETREQIEAHESLALQLRGRSALIESEIGAMRKHVLVLERLLKGGSDGVAE